MKTRKAFSIVSVIAVMVMASVFVAGTASAAPAGGSIAIKSQDCCNSGMVVVDSATAAQAGWLGIFRNSDGSVGSLVGYVPVMQGQNGQLTVDVDSKRIGSAATLWAGFLVDESGTGIFDPSTVALAPGTPLIAFGTQAAAPAAMALAAAPSVPTTGGIPAPAAPAANKISIKSQDCCNSGMVVVDSATAAQDGWLGIFRDSSGAVSSLVGFVPVVKGQNGQLTVDVDSKRIGSASTLWAGFLVDTTGASTDSPNFLFNIANLALAPNSPLVAFGTAANGQ